MSEVSSWFSSEVSERHVEPHRCLTIGFNSVTDTGSVIPGSLDVSWRVNKWPSIRRDWNKLAPNNIKIKLTNADQGLNQLHIDNTHLTKEACLQIGIGGAQLFENPYFKENATWTKRPSAPAVWSINANSGCVSLDYDPAITTDSCYLRQIVGEKNSYTGLSDHLFALPSYYRFRCVVDSFTSGNFGASIWTYDSEYHRTDLITGTPGNLGSSFALDEVVSLASGEIAYAGLYIGNVGSASRFIVNGLELARYRLAGSQHIIDPDMDTGSWNLLRPGIITSYSPGVGINFHLDTAATTYTYDRAASWIESKSGVVADKPAWYSFYFEVHSWTQGRLYCQFWTGISGDTKTVFNDLNGGVESRFVEVVHTVSPGSHYPHGLLIATNADSGNVDFILKNAYVHKYVDSQVTRIDLFKGEINRIQFSKGYCDISLTDKWDVLGRKIIGTDTDPVQFTGSHYLAHDLAWWVCTSFGGLSNIQNSSNLDIDWVSFNSWSSVMSKDQLFLNAYMEGDRVSEVLGSIAKLTGTAIYTDDQNRIKFQRFSAGNQAIQSFTGEHLTDLSLSLDEDDIENRIYANADYSVESDTYETTVVVENSESVNSFGLYEMETDELPVWLVGSTSAFVHGSRKTFFDGLPERTSDAESGLYGLPPEIGESINIGDTLLNLNETFQVHEKRIELDTGAVILSGKTFRPLIPFTLDVSALDSSDALL